MKKVLHKEGMKVPAKIWTDELSSMEEGALEQAELVCQQPWIRRAAFMPDMHIGMGCTIGAVIGTKNTLVPQLVGVDIGCFDKNTEFLSPKGWIKISEYMDEFVTQFNPETGIAEFVKPSQYLKLPCKEFYQLKTKYGVDQVLSSEHRCLVYKYDRSGLYEKYDVITAEELVTKHNSLKLGFRDKFLTAFKINHSDSSNWSNELIRVLVMLSADGSVASQTSWRLNFKKDRKIKRAKQLLAETKIEFSETKNSEITTLVFKLENVTKGLDQFWNANPNQLQIITEECLLWDGSVEEQCFYTRNKSEADFVHYVFAALGTHRSVLREDSHYRDGKIDYRVFRHSSSKVGIAGTPKTAITVIPSEDGYKYCFTVPSSYLVMRRNGNIFITGNCGMCVFDTDIHKDHFDKRDWDSIIKKVKTKIPMGFNLRRVSLQVDDAAFNFMKSDEIQAALDHTNFDSIPQWLRVTEERSKTLQGRREKLNQYLGTLGGGNHFIEFQADKDGIIHIMLHSGSRGPGEAIATGFMKLAKEVNEKWFSTGSKDFGFFPQDSNEGSWYLDGVQWAQDFAYFNRAIMMSQMRDIFDDYVMERGYNKHGISKVNPVINIHHNYVAQENHFGENLWVHRKGATRVRDDITGIIPGSMGTASYIVTGTNEAESLNSCSHGAGRKLGRKKAKEKFKLHEFKNAMGNVISQDINAEHLDESPMSYKNIEEVMENQKDLVKIVKKLTPIANIKA